MKFDIHNHILPENWPDLKKKYGYGGWIQLDHQGCQDPKVANMVKDGKVFRQVKSNCWNHNDRLDDMNHDGIVVQALSTVPVMFNYWAKPEDTLDFSYFLNNDLISRVRKHPKRFVALGTLPIQAPLMAVEEMKRCKHDLQMNGFQIGSHINEWNLDAKELLPIYKTAEDLGLALFVHPWDMELGGRFSKYWLPWLVGMPAETATAIVSVVMGGILAQFPKLKIGFAHGGGSFPFTLGRIGHGFRVRPDLCQTHCQIDPEQFLGKFYTDSLVHHPEALDLLLKTIGHDKVMLGTDYPFPLGEVTGYADVYPGKVLEKITDKKIRDKIEFENALDFLELEKSRFI